MKFLLSTVLIVWICLWTYDAASITTTSDEIPKYFPNSTKVFDDDSKTAFVDVGRAFDRSLRDAFPEKPIIIGEAHVQVPVMLENGCTYYKNSSFICDCNSMTDFPVSLPPDVFLVVIKSTNIVQIPDFALKESEMAVQVEIIENLQIQNVSRHFSRGATAIKYLYIRGNSEISSWDFESNLFSIFQENNQLVHLVLENNNIQTLGQDEFPLVLPNLEYLSLADNPIGTLESFVFTPLKESPVKSLNLQNCQLFIIEEGALDVLSLLEHLDLHQNPGIFQQNAASFVSLTRGLSKHINNIGLSSNQLTEIPSDGLANLNQSLITLNLGGNFFPQLGLNGFPCFPSLPLLKDLNLDYSGIINIQNNTFQNLVSLESISLVRNPLEQFPTALLLPSLSSIHLQTHFEAHKFSFPINMFKNRNMTKLRSLWIECAELKALTSDHLKGLSGLESLSLKSSKIDLIEENVFSELTNLRNLSLAFVDSEHPISWSTLQGPKKLIYLDLTETSLNLDFDSIKTFSSSKQIEVLNITGALKDIEGGAKLHFIKKFKHLRILEIGSNQIRSWNETLFHNLTNLETVRMRKNLMNIALSREMIMDFFNSSSLKVLDLSNNIFECNDMIYKFYKYVQFYPDVEIIGYNNGTGYCCAVTGSGELKTFQNFVEAGGDVNEGWQNLGNDKSNPVLQITLSSLTAFLVAGAISFLIYRNRWYLRYYYICYKQKHKQIMRREPFLYDAFISYSKNDEAWVNETLVPFLEENDPRLKLCIHQRDFKVGNTIVENIVEAIDSSRKVLVVLTKSYMSSSWCMFESQLTQHRLMDETGNMIIVNLTSDKDFIPSSIKHIISRVTYLSMTKSEPLPSPYLLPSNTLQPSNWTKLKVTLMEEN